MGDTNLLTLTDEEGNEYNVMISAEDYEKIISGDYDLANMYLQREIERKNRLLACQLFLRDSHKTRTTSSSVEKPGYSGIIQKKAPDPEENQQTEVLEEFGSDIGSDDKNVCTERWMDNEIKYLIDLYRTNFEKFKDKKYKTKSLYEEIAKKFPRFNAEKIETKIKNLKKTYKKILDNNIKTGRGKISWPYFNSLHEIFGSEPENNPLSVASNTLGFIVQPEGNDTSNSEADPSAKKKVKKSDENKILNNGRGSDPQIKKTSRAGPSSEPEWITELRKEMATRHQERMEKQSEFLQIFKELVENTRPKE